MKRLVCCLSLLAMPALAAAQTEPRAPEISAGDAWRHAATKLILPPHVGGLVRTAIRDNSTTEFILAADYSDTDEGMTASVRLYQTMVPNVPLWFDSALASIVLPYAGAAPPAVAAFTRPGASAASGLRAATTGSGHRLRSTAIAIAPLGSWLVAIRLDSTRLDPAALDEQLSAFIAALGWPAETGTARTAIPVEPCPAPLRLTAARRLGGRPHDVVAYWAGWTVLPGRDEGPPRVFCRDPGADLGSAVYRLDGATDSYLIPMANGFALAAGEETDLRVLRGERHRRRYSVTLVEPNALRGNSSFDRLPPPSQAFAAAFGSPSLLSINERR